MSASGPSNFFSGLLVISSVWLYFYSCTVSGFLSQENKLKVALLDYLQKQHPDDTDKFSMVAHRFSMHREIAQTLEETATKQLASLGDCFTGNMLYIILLPIYFIGDQNMKLIKSQSRRFLSAPLIISPSTDLSCGCVIVIFLPVWVYYSHLKTTEFNCLCWFLERKHGQGNTRKGEWYLYTLNT